MGNVTEELKSQIQKISLISANFKTRLDNKIKGIKEKKKLDDALKEFENMLKELDSWITQYTSMVSNLKDILEKNKRHFADTTEYNKIMSNIRLLLTTLDYLSSQNKAIRPQLPILNKNKPYAEQIVKASIDAINKSFDAIITLVTSTRDGLEKLARSYR